MCVCARVFVEVVGRTVFGQTRVGPMSGPRSAQEFFMFHQCHLSRVGADGGRFGPLGSGRPLLFRHPMGCQWEYVAPRNGILGDGTCGVGIFFVTSGAKGKSLNTMGVWDIKGYDADMG